MQNELTTGEETHERRKAFYAETKRKLNELEETARILQEKKELQDKVKLAKVGKAWLLYQEEKKAWEVRNFSYYWLKFFTPIGIFTTFRLHSNVSSFLLCFFGFI